MIVTAMAIGAPRRVRILEQDRPQPQRRDRERNREEADQSDQQPHAMPRPRQPRGAILEQQVQAKVGLPRDVGDADEPRIRRQEAERRVRTMS